MSRKLIAVAEFWPKKSQWPLLRLTGFRLSGQLVDVGLKYFTGCALSSEQNGDTRDAWLCNSKHRSL